METGDLNTTMSNGLQKRRVFIEDVITKDEEKAEPCLVKFSNGIIKNQEAITGKLLGKNSPSKNHQKERILRVKTPHMAYIGKNFGPSAFSNSTERFFLGILDEGKNRIKLVEMSSFLLQPELNSDTSSQDLNDGSKNSKRKSLLESFGGKRGRIKSQKITQREYSIDDMSSALHEAMGEIKPLDIEVELQNDMQLYNEILPPCDRKAARIQDVYSVSSIISDEVLCSFNDIAVRCLDGTFSSSTFSEVFQIMMIAIQLADQEESVQAKKLCIALYTEVLIQISKSHKASDILKTCPQVICSKVKNYYMDGKSRVQTKCQMDKLIIHILILVFLNNNYEVQLTILSKALQIQKEKLASYLRVVGATCSKNEDRAVLKLPLSKLAISKFKIPNIGKRR